MAWSDDIQTPLIIITGDGSQFTDVLWKNDAVKELDFNIAEFDFPSVRGSYINRGQPKGRKFSFNIFFQGDDHLDNALAFEKATLDPRPWKVTHPIFKSILVQPSSLKFDYSGFSVTQVTGTLLETIEYGVIQIVQSPRNSILFAKQEMDDLSVQSYEAQILQLRPTVNDINTLKGFNKLVYDINVKMVKLTTDAGGYFNAFNAANASLLALSSAPADALRNLQTVLNYPSQFVNTIKVRISTIQSSLDSLITQVNNLSGVKDKVNFQKTGTTLVSSMSIASVTSYDGDGNLVEGTTLPDYLTKEDVLAIITALQYALNLFLSALDSIQTDNGGNEDSFVPDADDITNLINLTNQTISNLYTIALSSKQERIVILERDSNVVLLTHRFYGLDQADANIDFFMKTNNILLDEYLQIKKGRTLKFYI
jgi:hypothetical protein